MVSIIEDFKKYLLNKKLELVTRNNIESHCYYYLKHFFAQESFSVNIDIDSKYLNEDNLATIGYLSVFASENNSLKQDNLKTELERILKTKPMAGQHYSSNVFILTGIYLLANHYTIENSGLNNYVAKALENGTLKDKFLIRSLKRNFDEIQDISSCQTLSDWLVYYFIKTIKSNSLKKDKDEISQNIVTKWDRIMDDSIDLIDIFLIEYWIKDSLKSSFSFENYTSTSLIKKILENFPNSIKKVTNNRRKDHPSFDVKDEYDVQDLIYLMLKPLFNDLKEEDAVPKAGGTATRIDFVIPSEEIGIECKMIKGGDSDEKKYIKEIKEDIQSYYKYPSLKYLIVFIYDPSNKTKDDNSFYEFNQPQKIKNKEFEVIVIVTH